MRFVRTSEQTEIISVHSNKLLVFTTHIEMFLLLGVVSFINGAVPWLRQLDFDIRLRSSAFDWRSVHQGIVVDNLAIKLGFLLVLRFDSHHGSDEEPPTSHSEGQGSNSGQSIWVLCYH
jgi:hypothetical protein